jgi:hypothetical protein
MCFDFISAGSTSCGLSGRAATLPSQFPSHSRAFGDVRDRPPCFVVPGHARPRLPPDGRQQNWKACWGNPQEFESLILRQRLDQER